MNGKLYPIIRAGIPAEIHALDEHSLKLASAYHTDMLREETTLWLRIGPELPQGANAYEFKPDEKFMTCQTIAINSLARFVPYKSDEYPEELKELPIDFAGHVVGQPHKIVAAGLLFRSGHHPGFVNIHSKW